MLYFVALTNRVVADELPHQLVVMQREEGSTDALQRLLDTLVAHVMSLLQNLGP
jgi:hypothetical protein